MYEQEKKRRQERGKEKKEEGQVMASRNDKKYI